MTKLLAARNRYFIRLITAKAVEEIAAPSGADLIRHPPAGEHEMP
jgi:hypothetical protein